MKNQIQVLENQKKELEKKLNTKYVERTQVRKAEKMMANDLIKVVLGPRRAGKSVFCWLLLKDKHFAYLNLEDDNLQTRGINSMDLLHQLFTVYGETKYLFFDEIQNLEKWELFVNRLHREGYNLVLTGSNAKLLSKELATHLTGRHIPIELMPFNFKEFLSAKNFQLETKNLKDPETKRLFMSLLELYMTNGGYPEIVLKDNSPQEYFDTLYDALLFKDVIKRYKVRFFSLIEDLGTYLINNVTSEFSFRKISHILNFKNIATLQKYVSYFEEAYIISTMGRYSYKTGERLALPKKVYTVDNGYIAAKAIQFSNNKGKLLENMIFSELLKKGFKPNHNLFYYKTRNQKEVDFVIRENLQIISLIQVAYDVDDEKTKKREIKALLEASKELNCNNLMILTWDNENIQIAKGKKIKFVPIWKWLLEIM